MSARVICFQHRLAGMSGHRFHQSMGLLAEARRRGMKPLLLMNAAADRAVRRALPGRAVLHDPVFRSDLSFDERTRVFTAMLHEHVDRLLRRDDRLLMTVATQCEARALAAWLAELPEAKRPWTVVLFPSDRWNRNAAAVGASDGVLAGPSQRARQIEEIRITGADLAALPEAVRRRLLLCANTQGLCDELAARLGTGVLVAPMAELIEDMPGPRAQPRPEKRPPRVAALGGARPEKGSHLLPEIVAASRRLSRVDFLVHLVNEQMPADAFARLLRLADEPGVETAVGALDRSAYLSLLAAADLGLFPYERSAYRHRTSGVFSEFVAAGLPSVVPSGTWLAQQVTSGAAAGVVYEGESAAQIAAAIADCVVNLERLSEQARQLAPEWRRTQTMTAFFDWAEGEIASRSQKDRALTGRHRG
jgi:glycosyltransferase involved in cell wall biosynthesis